MAKEDLEQVQQRLDEFRQNRRFAQLATLNQDGDPHASYAPCALIDGVAVVFLSQLSAHCRNLLLDSRASVLLLADENEIRNPFARQRLSYQCRAEVIEATHSSYEPWLNLLTEQHGETVNLLRQLPDFVLFGLTPISGTYIEGFGRAYTLTGERLQQLDHIDEAAIKAKNRL